MAPARPPLPTCSPPGAASERRGCLQPGRTGLGTHRSCRGSCGPRVAHRSSTPSEAARPARAPDRSRHGVVPPVLDPPGQSRPGAYPLRSDELLAIVAIERRRAGVRRRKISARSSRGSRALRAHGVLGTTVAWFHDGPPPTYPAENLATLSTHDLPTVASVWQTGWTATKACAPGWANWSARCRRWATPWSPLIVRWRAPSVLALATLDDLSLAERQANVPGTTHERPNWRIPLPFTIEEIARSPISARVAGAFRDRGDQPG
ncbi:MAG: 4-alpha-glucanotransferase [Ilumatobacteraceae bacterium]